MVDIDIYHRGNRYMGQVKNNEANLLQNVDWAGNSTSVDSTARAKIRKQYGRKQLENTPITNISTKYVY